MRTWASAPKRSIGSRNVDYRSPPPRTTTVFAGVSTIGALSTSVTVFAQCHVGTAQTRGKSGAISLSADARSTDSSSIPIARPSRAPGRTAETSWFSASATTRSRSLVACWYRRAAFGEAWRDPVRAIDVYLGGGGGVVSGP